MMGILIPFERISGKQPQEEPKMTNGDFIRSLNDSEMAIMLAAAAISRSHEADDDLFNDIRVSFLTWLTEEHHEQ